MTALTTFVESAHPTITTFRSPAFCTDEKGTVTVSGVADLAEASLSYNSIQGWDGEGRVNDVIELSRSVWRSRAIGDMWSYMLLAEGAVDIVSEWDVKPYDLAALIPIVEEAGGRFTTVDGVDGPWGGSSLASNGVLHEAVLAKLNPKT